MSGHPLVSVGVDVAEVERFRRVISRRPSLVDRVFTDAERAYAQSGRDPAERLAARFAAKEATMKALGVGLGAFAFRDVEVVRGRDGAPTLSVTGAAADVARSRGVAGWSVSLTHGHLVAIAVVVGVGGP